MSDGARPRSTIIEAFNARAVPFLRVQGWWIKNRIAILRGVLLLMAAAAAWRLIAEFYRLLWETGPNGAIDLKHLYNWVTAWFAGQPVYERSWSAAYPPATYLMLWPLLGWLPFTPARWLWALTSVGALAAFIALFFRISGAENRQERSFAALLVLSLSGTAVAIGNGQLVLHLLPALLMAVLVLDRLRTSFLHDLAAAGLVTWTLMKPSVAAPFLWVVLFGWNRWRPALLVLIIYSLLTLTAAAFQKQGVPAMLESCLTKGSSAVTGFAGTRNVHAALVAFGLEKWMTLTSVAIFATLGAWIYRYRRADPWVLVAVAALVARMWTYHRVYDDALILLPELALFRIAKQSSAPGHRAVAEVLIALTALAMVCPARFLDEPSSWSWIFTGSQTVLWLFLLAYLMNAARHDRSEHQRNAGPLRDQPVRANGATYLEA